MTKNISNLSSANNITNTSGNSLVSISNYNFKSFNSSLNGQEWSTYNVLGEEVEIESLRDPFLAQNLSLINILGKPFYEELVKNRFEFNGKIKEVLEQKFKILDRDKKINSVLDDKVDKI